MQHAYRIVVFLQTLEISFFICTKYLRKFNQFPSHGVIDNDFVDQIQFLYNAFFPHQFLVENPMPFFITKEVTVRGINLTSCYIRQFVLLFDDTHAPKLSSIGRQMVVISSNQCQYSNSLELPHGKNLSKEVESKYFVLVFKLKRRWRSILITSILQLPLVLYVAVHLF